MQNEYMHIALADDDEDDRLFFTDAFREIKMATKVSTYNDGLELMNHLESKDTVLPNILFLDLNMPKKNGMTCLKEIKANDKFNHMVIAIYSTSSSDEDIENTFVMGANIYIKKPSDFEELKKILTHIITLNWQYQTNGLNRDNFMLRL